MTHKDTYNKLKLEADQAYNLYSVSGSAMDWEWFRQCEHKCADFAFLYEKEIFGDDSEDY